MALPGKRIDCMCQAKPVKKLILELDASASETYGRQRGRAYKDRFHCQCCDPVFCFNQPGDVEAALLRHNQHPAAADALLRGAGVVKDLCYLSDSGRSGPLRLAISRVNTRASTCN